HFALLLFVQRDRLIFASYALGEHLLTLAVSPDRIHDSDLETLQEMFPHGEEGTLLAARYGRALDRSSITARFFRDLAAQRDLVSSGWTGIPAARTTDRKPLALLLLSRLMFLYFLQHRGFLGSDRAFLVRLFHSRGSKRSFFVST